MLAADSKTIHLHNRHQLQGRSKSSLYAVNTVMKVNAARPKSQSNTNSNTTTVSVTRIPGGLQSKCLLQSLKTKPFLQSIKTSVANHFQLSAKDPRSNATKKAVKVYLSQRQSSSLKDCGMLVPCAPPATPTLEYLQSRDYIPSLSDVKSQRDMRQRLEEMSRSEHIRLFKKQQEQLQQEKFCFKEKITEQKKRQRQEIYALNKVMRDLENKNFEELIRTKGLNK